MGRLTKLAQHLFILYLSAVYLAANPFTLESVSKLFPHRGLEDRIAFWKLVFTRFGERDVVFHDEDDLRLIYRVEHFSRERKNNPQEIRRQRDHLRRVRNEIRDIFDEMIKYGPQSSRMSSRHQKIIDLLTRHNYKLRASTLKDLRNRIRYQRGIKEKFREGLIRSGRYLERMQAIFASHDLPTEIVYLPHVESSFDYNAHSKAGAAGIWQFTRGTGRSYLRINRYIDERLDPILATEAAAKLMKDNYAALGSWPLAITGYNHGRNGMLRAKQKYGSDLMKIIPNYRSRYFGFASKNFYAEFLAVLEVVKNYKDYFGSLEFAPPFQFEALRLAKSYDSSYFTSVPGLTRDVLTRYNPHLRGVLSASGRVVPAGIDLRLPIGTREPLKIALQSAKPATSGAILASDGSTRYRVQQGDVLGDIAASFGTSVNRLQRLNGIRNPNRIRVGQVLLVASSREPKVTTSSERQVPSSYSVRSGDSMTGIARRFNTTVSDLARINAIKNPNRLYPGMNIQLPKDAVDSAKRYKVRRGDTLARIARRFGTSVSSIKQNNKIRNPNKIQPGQELLIP